MISKNDTYSVFNEAMENVLNLAWMKERTNLQRQLSAEYLTCPG